MDELSDLQTNPTIGGVCEGSTSTSFRMPTLHPHPAPHTLVSSSWEPLSRRARRGHAKGRTFMRCRYLASLTKKHLSADMAWPLLWYWERGFGFRKLQCFVWHTTTKTQDLSICVSIRVSKLNAIYFQTNYCTSCPKYESEILLPESPASSQDCSQHQKC